MLDAVAELDLPSLYRQTTVPLLVVTATRRPDDPFTRSQTQWLAAALAAVTADQPRVQLASVDADHGLVGTVPDVVATLVLDFLRDVGVLER